jgi:hypothetical protein
VTLTQGRYRSRHETWTEQLAKNVLRGHGTVDVKGWRRAARKSANTLGRSLKGRLMGIELR